MNQAENDIFPKHINYYLVIKSDLGRELLPKRVSSLNITGTILAFMLGGLIEWLIFGLEKVDPKIRLIAELNEMRRWLTSHG